ncbi:hypothetical protein M885DRAFT_509445 [Pelagophyceae sp. CCMP2097]|nr:hypothetical protein M885DRAFT_509445 [Pelagophyceae sp. CCMP2097]
MALLAAAWCCATAALALAPLQGPLNRGAAAGPRGRPAPRALAGKKRDLGGDERATAEARSLGVLRKMFDECDVTGGGVIQARELQVLMFRLGLPVGSGLQLREMITEYDVDEDGSIDFLEFVRIAADLRPLSSSKGRNGAAVADGFAGLPVDSIAIWADVFASLDTDGSGKLSAGEVRAAFCVIGQIFQTDDDVLRLMRQYDKDDDDALDLDEFRRMAVDIVSSMVQFERAVKESEQRMALKLSEAARRASAANEYSKTFGGEGEATVLEELQFSGGAEMDTAQGVQSFQDLLYRRFKARVTTGPPADRQKVDDALTAERVLLLDAIKAGDLDSIRALTRLDWNFVYPPRPPLEPSLEGWCRTPLCLLVRPDEGNFEAMLPGVSDGDRLDLIKDVLACGCADANFPKIYWSGPAVHACFEGDEQVLDLLLAARCDLSQRVLWALQPEAGFSLVHAAAFNNQVGSLRYLRRLLPPSKFKENDGGGNNALHVVLESARGQAAQVCAFLCNVGVDGFSRNREGRSALSMAIEYCPAVARALLLTKSRFEYRWWGRDLFWFSLDGIVLPLQPRDAEADSVLRPLTVRDGFSNEFTIEALILLHDRKELLETPVLLDLLDRKWASFARAQYQRRTATFAILTASVLVASVAEPGSDGLALASGVAALTWALFLRSQLLLFVSKVRAAADARRGAAATEAKWTVLIPDLKFFDYVDTFNVLLTPCLLLARADRLDFIDSATLAPLVGLLQVSLALRLLEFVSVFESLGPLLITVLKMLSDALRFAGLVAIVTLGFADGFYSLIHFGVPTAQLATLSFDYSYTNILSQMLLWLAGQPSFAILEGLEGEVFVGAEVLFWAYIGTAYFVLLNLLIAIFNDTYNDIISKSNTEWLCIRLRTMLEFEDDVADPSVQLYYQHLLGRDNKRAVITPSDSRRRGSRFNAPEGT